MTLSDFPRGGKKIITRAPSNFLFDKKENVKNKRTKNKRVEEDQFHVEEPIAPNVAQCLTVSSLVEGMIVLGRVYATTEYDVSVSLPGRLIGLLPVINVSQTYTNLLQNLVENEDNHPPEFKPLNELYKRGDYIVCYIKSINVDSKYRMTLSIEPELINQNLDPEKLQKGSKIACSISSIEDHGYVVDTGMKVLRGFLSNKDINDGIQYYPGQQVFCAIKSVKSIENITTAKLSTKSKHTTSAVSLDDQSLDSITPGTSITLEIKSILSNGLQVTYNKNNIGYINQLYLNNRLSSYEQNDNIVGKLLYILPTVKLAYFTEILPDQNKESVKIGEIIEKAKFLYRESNGIVLRLMKGTLGFVSFKRTGVDFDAIPSKFIPKSVHKCRIINYDIFDRIYICTMEQHLLKDKFIAPDSVKAGDVMTVEIMRINEDNGFVFVKSGNILGDVPPLHIADIGPESEKKLQIGAKIQARVLGKNKLGNGFLFTLKKSLVESKLPILSEFNNAKVGARINGTITSIVQHGLLVTFFNNIKGLVPLKNLTKKTGGILNYTAGQVLLVKINKIINEKQKLLLSLVEDKAKKENEIQFKIGESVEGTVVESSVDGIYLKIYTNNGNDSAIGFLPAGHMAPCMEIATYLSARYLPGDKLSALVFSTSPDFLLTRTFVPQENYTNLTNIQLGSCIPCSIKEINKKTGLKVVLPINDFESYGNVLLNKIDNIDVLFTHQILFGKITNINKKEKKINLSTALVDVWNNAVMDDPDMIGAVDQLTLYLSKLKELSNQPYYKKKSISSIKLGERMSGEVEKVTSHGLVLRLNNDITGTVRPAHYKGTFKVGDKVTATVLWINFIHELVEVTMLPMLINGISEKQVTLSKSSMQTQLRGEVVLVTNWFVLVVLKGQGKGRLAVLPSRRHINDTEPNLKPYVIGKKIRCYAVLNKNESELLPICLVKSAFELRKKMVSNEAKKMKRKIENLDNNDDLLINRLIKPSKMIKQEAELNEKIEMPEKPTKADKNITKKRKIMEKTKLNVENDENKIVSTIKNEKIKEIAANLEIPECGFYWDTKASTEYETKDESSSDEDDNDYETQQQQKKMKKLNAAERREMERQKEREIREREEALMSNQTPNSVDQFDRLVLASPDSSIIWLQYMAYHLQATELEKARAVAKRALKTINYREENEKLNVWQAWLNLESRFGTPESLNDVFQQAVKANDSKNIYLHMLTVHADAGRNIELEKMIKTVTGKFKQLPQMWIEVGTALLKLGLKDKSRYTMQRALQSLPPHEHVNLMVRFAQLENKLGDKERAQTLFEQILSSYCKRLDIWSAYVDTLVKDGDIEAARQVLNKAVIQKLPPRKMRTLFKKFIAFEEQHGTPEGVAHARQLAVAYVENKCNKDLN